MRTFYILSSAVVVLTLVGQTCSAQCRSKRSAPRFTATRYAPQNGYYAVNVPSVEVGTADVDAQPYAAQPPAPPESDLTQTTPVAATTPTEPRQSIPVGVTLTFPATQLANDGVALLKAGPIVLKLDVVANANGSTSVVLPQLKLMRAVDAELYLLTAQGQLTDQHSIELINDGPS